ncbi:MAG: hypothetical protein V3S15_01285, partial [Woeseiaceae bacterium]
VKEYRRLQVPGDEERKLQWQLASAVCVIDMMLEETGDKREGGVTCYDISQGLFDRIADVFKDYP